MSQIIFSSEVKKHKHSNSAWVIIHHDVYDLTKFLDEHPGGADSILEVAGKDGTQPFEDVGHSDDARIMMAKYKIGTLPPGERGSDIPCCPNLPKDKKEKKTWRTYDGSPSSSARSKLKWALFALAGALVIGIVMKKFLT